MGQKFRRDPPGDCHNLIGKFSSFGDEFWGQFRGQAPNSGKTPEKQGLLGQVWYRTLHPETNGELGYPGDLRAIRPAVGSGWEADSDPERERREWNRSALKP